MLGKSYAPTDKSRVCSHYTPNMFINTRKIARIQPDITCPITSENNTTTIITKRIKKDIRQALYEFPLLEFCENVEDQEVIERISHTYSHIIKLEKHTKTSVHKLTHQHIYATFWLIYIDDKINNSLPISEVEKYPLPILIAKFLKNIIL